MTPDVLDATERQLSADMYDRVAVLEPDLNRIVAGAVRDGRRTRRNRRLAGGAGVAALICLGAGFYAAVPDEPKGPGEGPMTAKSRPDPTTVERHGEVALLRRNGAPVAVVGGSAAAQQGLLEDLQTSGDIRGGLALVPTPPRQLTRLRTAYPEIDRWRRPSLIVTGPGPAPQGLRPRSPITTNLAGWTCDWYPIDDKGDCSSAGATLGMVWRPAGERADFVAKEGGATGELEMLGGRGVVTSTGTIVGPVRDGIFVTVQGGQGADAGVMATVARSLRWVE